MELELDERLLLRGLCLEVGSVMGEVYADVVPDLQGLRLSSHDRTFKIQR